MVKRAKSAITYTLETMHRKKINIKRGIISLWSLAAGSALAHYVFFLFLSPLFVQFKSVLEVAESEKCLLWGFFQKLESQRIKLLLTQTYNSNKIKLFTKYFLYIKNVTITERLLEKEKATMNKQKVINTIKIYSTYKVLQHIAYVSKLSY